MKNLKNLKKDKKGVFGLTSVQAFFSVILGLALLAYVIVAIMGTLQTSNIVPLSTLSVTVINETLTTVTEAGETLSKSTLDNAVCSVSICINSSNSVVIPTANWSAATNCVVKSVGVSAFNNTDWKCTYSATYNVPQVNDGKTILANVSGGVSSFFGAINPVYAILAILVIILVLVVLVRVVQAPSGSSRETPGL